MACHMLCGAGMVQPFPAQLHSTPAKQTLILQKYSGQALLLVKQREARWPFARSFRARGRQDVCNSVPLSFQALGCVPGAYGPGDWAGGVFTWAALDAKLRDDRVSPAEVASGDRLHTSITFEDPHSASCSTCMAGTGSRHIFCATVAQTGRVCIVAPSPAKTSEEVQSAHPSTLPMQCSLVLT